jgi:hypothetical protein
MKQTPTFSTRASTKTTVNAGKTQGPAQRSGAKGAKQGSYRPKAPVKIQTEVVISLYNGWRPHFFITK